MDVPHQHPMRRVWAYTRVWTRPDASENSSENTFLLKAFDVMDSSGNDLSPATWVFLLASVATVLWALWIRVRAALAWLGFVAEPGDELLEPLFRSKATREKPEQSKSKKKIVKGVARKTVNAREPPAEKKKPVDEAVQQRQPPRISLKALKKKTQSSSSKSAVSHHSSPLYVGTLVHGDEITGCTFSAGGTIVSACRDRLLRQFKIPSSSSPHTITAFDSRLVQRGIFDVCCVGRAIAVITRGAGGEPAIESRVLGKLDTVSGVHERIFAPKSNFEPLKLVGAGSTIVAASSDPRVGMYRSKLAHAPTPRIQCARPSLALARSLVRSFARSPAVLFLADDGTLTSSAAPGTSFDTSSIVNHDVAISPDGSGRFAVATFSSDVPIFAVERAKMRKISSCVGAKKKVLSVAWSPCSGFIAASSEDMMLRVYDVGGVKAQYGASTTAGVPSSAALSSLVWVGDRVVGAAGTDVFVFDGATLEVLAVIRDAHAGPISLAAGVRNDFVSWSSNSARLWKLQ